MKHDIRFGTRFFFATSLMPCPYLPGRVERRVVTELAGRDVIGFHDMLSLAGFRRSHDIAYIPACPDCEACRPARVVCEAFEPSRTQRRIWRANRDLWSQVLPPVASPEQYALFARYQGARHTAGDMARMDFGDYQALVEDTPVDTELAEFRDPGGELVAACLVDRLEDGLSAVYSYFEPKSRRRSLGTYVILWLIERARAMGRPYVYLGFWIADCTKMSYKAQFRPLETHTAEGWRLFEPEE